MNTRLQIFIDRLQEGKSQKIDERLAPSALNLNDDMITFKDDVVITGSAYLTDEFLIVQLAIKTKVWLNCSLCNEPMSLPIELPHVVEEVDIEELKGQVFDYSELVREAILLEIPFYVQCGGDVCKNRKDIEKYLRKDSAGSLPEEDVQQPFKDLL